MCHWCKDLRNVEPAKYISVAGESDPDWLIEAKKRKAFLTFVKEEDGSTSCYEIFKCPHCGQQFRGNEELYDEYYD